MEASCEEGREDEVVEGMEGGIADKDEVEENLGCDVDEVDACERHLIYEDGAHGIEENLKGAEECFSKQRVQEHGFEGSGEVGVEPVHAEGFVVRQMVRL